MTTYKPSHLVPKLRFPKFEGAGDWEEKQLSSLVKLVSGVHLAPDMYSTTGEVPYFTGPSDFTDAIQCVAKWTDESVNIAKQHDTLITVKGSGVGKIWYLTLPSIAMGRQLMAVRTEVGDRRFIYQLLSTRRAQFEALASGNLIPGLSRDDILGMAAYFPSRDEQQKISDCLGSLDDLIAAEGRKLEALRQHKQGLMQQLLPQPGETVPRLRFPEFRNAANWKTKILGTQGRFLSSLTGKAAKDFDTGDAAFIPYMNVFSNAFTNTTDLRSVNVADDESQSAVAKGDVFFTVSSETPEEAGMSSVLLEEIGNCYLNSFCALFRFDEGKSPDPVFLGYLLRSAPAREHLSRGAQGATRYNISRATFRSLPILIPSGPEQKKIADCLGPLDDLIAAEGRKLDSLRQHKRGLIQQLFPSLKGH